MASILHLECSDLAALVQRGLGSRVQEVRCACSEGRLRFSLDKLDVTGWLPRLGLEIDVAPSLDADRQEFRAGWKVVPSSFIGILAGPVQHLGVGSRIVDLLIDRLGWSEAVISRGDDALVLGLQRLAPLQRLGIHLHAVVVEHGLRVHLSAGAQRIPQD